jgi:hypothetical protein
MNATHHHQKFKKVTSLVHCEPLMLVVTPNVQQPHFQNTTPKFHDVLAAAKPNLSDTESRELEELLT